MGQAIFVPAPSTEPQPSKASTLATLSGSECDTGPWGTEGMTRPLVLFSIFFPPKWSDSQGEAPACLSLLAPAKAPVQFPWRKTSL